MPEQDEQQKRSAPVSYRPPKDREAEFQARVAASGLPANAFITQSIFGRSRHRPNELAALARLLGQAATISDSLHDIALTGDHNSAPAIAQAQAELAQIRAALLSLMGRKP